MRSLSNIRKISFAHYSIFEPQLRIPLKEFDWTDVKNDEMIGVDENDNKTEYEDATHDKVDDFNEDTCDLCIYDFLTFENF